MKNCDVDISDVNIVRNAIRRLGPKHTIVTTVTIEEEVTGREFVPDRLHGTNINFGRFLSIHKTELGLRFLHEGTVDLGGGSSTTSAFWEII
jgi:hypothetical protein